MALSEVAICNEALTLIGSARIASLTENTENARRLNAIYDHVRDDLLSQHPWNFAIARVLLVESAEVPAYGYTKKHTIPSDCLRVLLVLDGTSEEDLLEDFVIEGGFVLTDESTIYIKYIKQITDPTKYTNTFVSCFATRLAAEIAYASANSSGLAKNLFEIYMDKLATAKGVDAQESGMPNVIDNEYFIQGRI